jgi:thioredoxin
MEYLNMMKLFVMLMMVGAGMVFIAGNCQAAGKDSTKVSSEKNAVKLKIPKLIDFGAEKCGECKRLAPILEKMKQDYASIMDVVFVDVWQKKNVALAQQHKIESIPTQIFFNAAGKELWRHVGFISEQDIVKQLKKLGYDVKAMKKAKLAKQKK